MSKRKEIDPEFRIWLIEECLAGRMRGREAARRAGISSSAMRKWISLYKMDGPAAFASSNAKRTYSEEIKKKVVKDHLNGRGSFQTLCEKYHLRSPELVNRWVKSYNGHKDQPIFYIAYLIISSVQLGATVDYTRHPRASFRTR